MSHVFTPNTNVVANIQNRRSQTKVIENLKADNVFDSLIRTEQEFGDTLEHVMTALSESEDYDVTATRAGNYKATVLNKWYSTINWAKTYFTSTMRVEYTKALKSAKALADLVKAVLNKQILSWKYDQYNQFVSMFESDTNLHETEVENFGDFDSLDKAGREDKIEKFLQKLFETIIDMGFYSNKYITVDTGLTAEQQARMIATAPMSELTVYLNAKYFTWTQVDLSKRFRNQIDMDKKVTFKIVNFKDASRVGYITHNMRYQFVPKTIVADEIKPFATTRTDHALITEGTFATIPLFPATVLKQAPLA